ARSWPAARCAWPSSCGRGASPCSSPTRETPRPCAATFSRRRWPRWSRPRSWPCSIRMGARSMRAPPLTAREPVLAVPLREGLPNWRVAVYAPPGASPRDVVRRQVMLFTGAFGVLVAVIVAGVVLTVRLTRRETEMAQLKADFVANVSHDLKTPLSVIRMFGETLEMGRVPDE